MITAEQARRMATSLKTTKKYVNRELKIINEDIKQAARRGGGTSISYRINYYNYTKDIMKKLQEVGYRVRDGYSCGIIEIDWSETK